MLLFHLANVELLLFLSGSSLPSRHLFAIVLLVLFLLILLAGA